MQCDAVFERRPELAKEARHLATTDARGPDDHNNPRTFLSWGAGQGQDRARVAVAPVSLLTCWNLGGERAASALTRDGLYTAAEVDWASIAAATPDVDMLRPFPDGNWVGVTVTDDDVEKPITPAPTADAAREAEAAVTFEESLPVMPTSNELIDLELRVAPCSIEGVPGCIGPVGASKALRIAMDGLSKTSDTSRIARSIGKGKSGEEVTSFASTGEEILAGSSPCMVLVLLKGFGVTPAILLPESFTFLEYGTKVTSTAISTELFHVPGSTLTGHVMVLKPNGATLVWRSGGSCGPRVTVECVHAVTLNPDVDILPPDAVGGARSSMYTFDVASVSEAAKCLWSEVQPSRPKLAQLPEGGCLPYKAHLGGDHELGTITAFNLAGSAEAMGPACSAAAAAATTRLVTCAVPGCGAEVQAKEMRQHAAWHIKVQPQSVATLMMPCGLCASYEQMQYSASAADAPGCCVWLENDDTKRKATTPRTFCKVVGEVAYRQSDAEKCSKASPATNHIVACPVCPVKPMRQFFWSYNMDTHWKRAHSSQQMPPELLKEITVTEPEQTGLQKLKVSKLSKRKAESRDERAVEAKRTRMLETATQPLGCGLRVDNEGQLLGAEEGAEEGAEMAEAEAGDTEMAKADDDAPTAAAAATTTTTTTTTTTSIDTCAVAAATAYPAAATAHATDAADTTNPAAAKTASETVEAAEAEATVQHMFACCLSEERDGQWQCNGGCGRNNGGRWFHVSCKLGGQHGDRASPLCKECVAEAMAGGHRPKRAKV
jgi:hypothetical protein